MSMLDDALQQQVKIIDHDGTRTHNLLIRSQTPYPLGHAVFTQANNIKLL